MESVTSVLGVMELRFVQWQQAMLIVSPFVLLFAYVVWVYFLVRRRSLRSVVIRVLVASAVSTALWAFLSFVLFIIAWAGTSDVTASYDARVATYNVSIDLPFYVFHDAMWRLQQQLPEWMFPRFWVPALPLFGALLVLEGAIALAQHVLAESRFSVEKVGKVYAGSYVAVSVACLLVILWPQPSRNPDMPSVPIPDEAVVVEYSRTAGEQVWPQTTFMLERRSSRDSQTYYEEELVRGGWKLEYSESSDDCSGVCSSRSLFSQDGKILEVWTAQAYGTSVVITEHQALPAELAQVAGLPKPSPMPTKDLAPPPAPEPTVIVPAAIPSISPPLNPQPQPTSQGR